MDIIIGAIILFILVIAAVVIAPTVKMALGIAPFLYTNTRCSAKSGLILKRKTYDSLLASTYLKEVYAALEETSYSHVAEHGSQFGSASVLLEKDLYDTYTWLESVMPEKLRPIITAMKIRFEVNELKEVMNRLQNEEAVGELHYVANTNVRLKLEEATDMNSFTTALEGTGYGSLISGDGSPKVATELDRYHLGTVLDKIEACDDKKAAEPFREYWRRVIDLANIRLACRSIREGGEGLRMIEGGLLPTEKLGEVSDKNQLAEILQGTPYEDIDVQEAEIKLEQSFLRAISQEGARASAKHPLKGGPIVNFLIQKELEIRNLNIILKLKAEGFKAEEIDDLLVTGA